MITHSKSAQPTAVSGLPTRHSSPAKNAAGVQPVTYPIRPLPDSPQASAGLCRDVPPHCATSFFVMFSYRVYYNVYRQCGVGATRVELARAV